MKKNKIFLSSLLCASAICSVAFSGCGNMGQTDGDSGVKEEPEKAERQVVLEDFEKDDYMFYVNKEETQLNYEGGFIANDKAKEHLTDGRALEINIRKYVSESWAGYDEDTGLCAITDFDLFSTPKNNGNWGFKWEYLSELSLDAYNPNAFPIRISMYNLTRNGYPINFGTTTLQAGETGKLVSHVNRYYMQNEFSDKISHLLFAVNYDKTMQENGDLYYPEATVYIDNVTATVNENSVNAKNGTVKIAKTLASENEILNFDDVHDLDYVRETGGNYVKDADNEWGTRYWYCGTGSSYYYNSNPQYIYSGNKGSAEWRVTPVLQTEMVTAGYDWNTRFAFTDSRRLTGITLEGDYLNSLNFARVEDGNVKICLDIYNAATYDKDIFFGIHDTRGIASEIKTEFPFMYGSSAMTDEWYKLKAGEWTTIEISDFSHLDLSKGLARLRVMTSLADVEEEISFYLNNLRFVETGKEDTRIVAETVDTTSETEIAAAKIYPSYNYKLVKAGDTVKLPDVTFSQNNVTAKYILDGQEVAANSSFTPTETGVKKLEIKAKNADGKVSTKTIVYTVTDNEKDKQKVYALDTKEGLEYHAGKAGMGLNCLRLNLVNKDNLKKDVFGNVIPLPTENGEAISDSYVYISNYGVRGRITLSNALYTNVDKEFDGLYFYFYNGGEASVTISFNNYSQDVAAKSGWTKIEIKDFELITSNGGSANVTSMIDASDMVGSFIKINTTMPYEKYAISAIYGIKPTPKQA